MLNVCPVGRSCSQEERDEFGEYDKVLSRQHTDSYKYFILEIAVVQRVISKITLKRSFFRHYLLKARVPRIRLYASLFDFLVYIFSVMSLNIKLILMLACNLGM